VVEAETALAAVAVRMAKQTLVAPRGGLISEKLVNAGELAAPGAALLELSDIETVELTVYIPETEIGRVKIGEAAQVHVDAYESETFSGAVSFIAHEAEFTPRNVQTQEERVNLVFAVKIKLDNADHRLKPGMPADAEILPGVKAEIIATAPAPTMTPTMAPAIIPPASTPVPAPTATATAGLPAPGQPASPTPVTPTAQAEIVAWSLKVRTGPGIDYPTLAHLSQGERVPVLSVDPASGWLEIKLSTGEIGWITGSQTYVLVR